MSSNLKRSSKGKSIYPKLCVWREPSRICMNIAGVIVDVKPDASHHYGHPKLYERLVELFDNESQDTNFGG